MDAENSNDAAVEQFAAYLMRSALIDLAAVMRRGDRYEAAVFLEDLEQRFAWTLFQFWLRSQLGRSRPDLIAATALRLRGMIRGEGEMDPPLAHAA